MIDALPPVIVQKLNVLGLARAVGEGAQHGRTFERAYAAGRYGTALSAARRARRLAREHGLAGHSAVAGAHLHYAPRASRAGFSEGLASTRGVSNRLIVRTALSRRMRIPVSMRAGFLAGAARNVVRVRSARVRGGVYLRRTPA